MSKELLGPAACSGGFTVCKAKLSERFMVERNRSAMKGDALICDNWRANATIRREAGEAALLRKNGGRVNAPLVVLSRLKVKDFRLGFCA